MEINTSGLRKAGRAIHPHRLILAEMYRRKIPVVLGSDAHAPEDVAGGFEEAFALLEAIGYRSISYFRKRSRIETDLQAARKLLLPLRNAS